MHIMRWLLSIILVSSVFAITGCAGSQGTGKNKDYDRPKAPSTKG